MSRKLRSSSSKAVCTFLFKVSELSKLKIKIQNNNEMISSKDQIIEQLRDELRRASPMKQYDQPKLNQVNSVNSNITQKINDV